MAYDIAIGGDVVDLATISGWKIFKKELIGKGDELDKFIKDAHADAELLLEDLEALDDEELTESTQRIVDGMLDSLSGAEGDVYITDGF